MKKKKVSKESKTNRTANDRGVTSTDLLESIVSVKELEPGGLIERQLDTMAKKYGLEYQLIVGAKNRSWSSSYHGEGKIINDLGVASLRYIFLAPQNVPHFQNKK